MNKHAQKQISRLLENGIKFCDALALRRISMTLHSWFELECGNSDDYKSYSIERDEETEIPYMVVHMHNPRNWEKATRKHRISDRETGARRRLARIMSQYPDLTYYVQTDPRGCALYIMRKDDYPDRHTLECNYNRGIAVFK